MTIYNFIYNLYCSIKNIFFYKVKNEKDMKNIENRTDPAIENRVDYNIESTKESKINETIYYTGIKSQL